MAKILLVSKKLSPTCLRLTMALRHQQHQVSVLTSMGEDARFPDGVECMTPFRSWSLLEGLRWLPALLTLQPQIIHLILDEDDLSGVQAVLSMAAKGLPNTVLTTSLLSIKQGLRRRNPVRYLLQESDIVTCPSVESLGSLRGLRIRSTRQGRGILPPAIDFSDEGTEAPSGHLAELEKSLHGRDYLVMPFFEMDFDPSKAAFDRLAMMASHRHVVLLGSFSNWTLRERRLFQRWMQDQGLGTQWTLTGPLGRAESRKILAGAEALVLAGTPMSPFEATEFFLRTLQAGATPVLDEKQASIHSELWKHGENCWILPHGEINRRLNRLLNQGSLKRPASLPINLSLHRDLIDAPLNELNRLYNRALANRHLV